MEEDELEFIVRLCHDVLLEALLFGDRRRIVKLERVSVVSSSNRKFLRTEAIFTPWA